MKHILYISLLLFTYSCKTKKAVETPANKLWQSGIDTITLPDNNAVLQPPFGDESLIDTGGGLRYNGERHWKGWDKPKNKHLRHWHILGKNGKNYWVDVVFNDFNPHKNSGEFDLHNDSVQLGVGSDFGANRGVIRADLVAQRRFEEGITGLTTGTISGGDSIPIGSIPRGLSGTVIETNYYTPPKPTYDTLKTIASYVDTSVEARPNVIDWKYLYYVRRIDVLFSRDNYYLELDKKRIKSSIVVLEARILDPK